MYPQAAYEMAQHVVVLYAHAREHLNSPGVHSDGQVHYDLVGRAGKDSEDFGIQFQHAGLLMQPFNRSVVKAHIGGVHCFGFPDDIASSHYHGKIPRSL
jgi:hypothetical protein